MNKNLDHLTNDQIRSLIERYYTKETVSALLKEYNINVHASELIKLFPPQITETLCPYCAIQMHQKYQSKIHRYSRLENPQCPRCDHWERPHCDCINCSTTARRYWEAQQTRRRIEDTDKQDYLFSLLSARHDNLTPVDLDSISFTHKIYLGALLRAGISEDYNYIQPIRTFTTPLGPTADLQHEIASELHQHHIISIHPDSDYSAFTEDDTTENGFRFNTLQVKWSLNVTHNGLTKVPLINSIINPTTEPDSEEAYLLWRKIALHESIEYLLHNIRNVMEIEYTIGDKTIAVIEELLNDFSVSQIYNFIYTSTSGALRFQKEQGVPTRHAANTIIGRVQRSAERAKVEGWNIKKYGRPKECPESALSQFFFERILKIGYNGFNEIPNIIT